MLGIKTLVPADFMIKAIPRKSYRRAPDDEVEYRTHALFKYPNWMIEQKTTTEILLNNTLFPITKALGRSNSNTVVTPRNWKKICPDCALNDYENYGTAYVHRSHVQMSVHICSVHGAELITTCPKCLIPILYHKLSQLGVCSQSYKNISRQPGSLKHLHAGFVAGLLRYDGIQLTRHGAQWIVSWSLYLKYSGDERENDDYIAAGWELSGRKMNGAWVTTSDDSFMIQAFLGCGTAERYLHLLANKAAKAQLENEVSALRNANIIARWKCESAN